MIVRKVTDSFIVSPGDIAEVQIFFTLIYFIASNVDLSKWFSPFSVFAVLLGGGKEREGFSRTVKLQVVPFF